MKGIGRVPNWKIVENRTYDMVWKKTKGKPKKLALSEASFGGRRVYEVFSNYPKGKVSMHKTKANALKKVKSLMKK